MGELIVSPGVTPVGLDWMKTVHRPDELIHVPLHLKPVKTKQGQILIDRPHAVCLRGDVTCCHVGSLTGIACAPSEALAAWFALTFFATPGLQPVELMTRDGLERMVKDAKAPKIEVCGWCGGSGMEPAAKPDEDGLTAACKRCHGEPRTIDETEAAVQIGPVKVLLHELKPFLPHLGGANISLGVAPHIGGSVVRQDLHIRHVHVTDDARSGLWRVTVMAL